MKIDFIKKQGRVRSLRAKLTTVFILFGAALLAILWIFQSVFLEKYYEISMRRKLTAAENTLSSYYANTEHISYEDFAAKMFSVASDNDVYFYVESDDGSISISSVDIGSFGVFFNNKSLNDARRMLANSPGGSISFISENKNPGLPSGGKDHEDRAAKTLICASRVQSPYRNNAVIYAAASLTPLGPAVNILRSQLLFVTIAVFVLCIAIAAIVSKRLADPMTDMSREAEKLGSGDFSADFKGADYREINELADTLNNATKALKSTDDLNKDIMANVSHDLRTPLTMIRSYAEMIKDISGDNKEKRDEHLGVIIDECDRLAKLVNDIFTLSKMQSGVDVPEDEVFDLRTLAESVFATYKIMEQEGFEMVLQLPENEALVYADESKISQVLANFLSNAARYSDEQKYIALRIICGDHNVRCEVEDHGVGIPDEDREKIWNRYEKASSRGVRSEEGSGLGLSICSQILKMEHARYGVSGSSDGGSIFWFELPNVK